MRLKMTWIIFMLGFMFLYGCSQKEYLLFDFLKINEYDIKKIEIRKSGYMEPVYISTEGEKIKECVKQLKSIHIVEKSNATGDGSLFVAFSLILWFNMTVKITKDDQHAKICQKEITEKSRGIAGKPWIEPE